MGRRPVAEHLKKKPSSYPQLAFRLSATDKKHLLKLAKTISNQINATSHQDAAHVTIGDVFVEALKLGFEKLQKK